jgi:SAM-dependent methyltransferase
MDGDAIHMRSAWDAQAANWIAWARAPEHDHFFWRLGLPALLALLPAPGRRTLDLACGEGRVSRVLAGRGHDMVGVEGSPALAAAARAAAPAIEVLDGDAAAIPLPDGAVDLVVCSMALLNFDDVDAAVREAARVLEPGGRLCFSTVHPWNSLKSGLDYFAERTYEEERTRGGLTMTFTDRHRPLQALSRALEGAGLLVEALREPVPDAAHIAAHPSVEPWTRRPAFLLGRALSPSRAAS